MVSINFEGAKQFYAKQPDKTAAQAAFDTLVNGTGAGNDFIHHHFCETVMLKFRINGEVDDMKSSGFMKLGGPSGVEVIFSEDKVEKCLHSRILVEQPAVCDEAFFQADKIIIKCMTVIRLIRNDQDSFQLFTIRIHLTRFKTFRYIARK